MKRFGFIILGVVVTLSLVGCGKKQSSTDEASEPMTMESLNVVTADNKPMLDTKAPAEVKPVVGDKVKPQQAIFAPSATTGKTTAVNTAAPLPPATFSKPTGLEIQTALKNVGFYSGVVDGKMGAKTKQAVKDFQKKNGLDVDGRVGPKTWAVLGTHLNSVPATKAKQR